MRLQTVSADANVSADVNAGLPRLSLSLATTPEEVLRLTKDEEAVVGAAQELSAVR